jgi:hypothetical protein
MLLWDRADADVGCQEAFRGEWGCYEDEGPAMIDQDGPTVD